MLSLWKEKEQAFWELQMGISGSSQSRLENAQLQLQSTLASAQESEDIHEVLRDGEGDDPKIGQALVGWKNVFDSHRLGRIEVHSLQRELIAAEEKLLSQRNNIKSAYTDPRNGSVIATSTDKLLNMVQSHDDHQYRLAAFVGLRQIERDFLHYTNFLEVVKLRNQLARLRGYENFYELSVQTKEGTSKEKLFSHLSEILEAVSPLTKARLARLEKVNGFATEPWNYFFLANENYTNDLGPYFPLQTAFYNVGRTLRDMGISFRKARLRFDLLERAGKLNIGFMNLLSPTQRMGDLFRPAEVGVATFARPGTRSSGYTLIGELLQESALAAAFSNIDSPGSAYALDIAPFSSALAELTSLFFESFVTDGRWLQAYGRDATNAPIPPEIIHKVTEIEHSKLDFQVLHQLDVALFENELYQLSGNDLNPGNVLALARAAERKVYGIAGASSPILTSPHLLFSSTSATSHSYVLAHAGKYQLRKFLEKNFQTLSGNRKIGPSLTEFMWKYGNQRNFFEGLHQMTGKVFSVDALKEEVALTFVQRHERLDLQLSQGFVPSTNPVYLDASISLHHGDQVIGAANEDVSFEALSRQFEEFVLAQVVNSGGGISAFLETP